jgi:sucrose-phosphate synthase
VLDRYTWERTAENYLGLLEEIVTTPEARRPDQLLSIHPYFRHAKRERDVTLDELRALYFASE